MTPDQERVVSAAVMLVTAWKMRLVGGELTAAKSELARAVQAMEIEAMMSDVEGERRPAWPTKLDLPVEDDR